MRICYPECIKDFNQGIQEKGSFEATSLLNEIKMEKNPAKAFLLVGPFQLLDVLYPTLLYLSYLHLDMM